MTFTTEKKADKFDEIMAGYGGLQSYRNNLAAVLISNKESYIEEEEIKSGAVLTKQVDKQIGIDAMRNIQIEIDRVDTILSFINSVVYNGDENKQNYEGTNSEPNSQL